MTDTHEVRGFLDFVQDRIDAERFYRSIWKRSKKSARWYERIKASKRKSVLMSTVKKYILYDIDINQMTSLERIWYDTLLAAYRIDLAYPGYAWGSDECVKKRRAVWQHHRTQLENAMKPERKPMKAITLHEPWASLVAQGHKKYETRHWQPSPKQLQPGDVLAIHAGKKWDTGLQQSLVHLKSSFPVELNEFDEDSLVFGCIVAACRLVAVHRTDDICHQITALERAVGNYDTGRYAWELELIRVPSEPIPAQGQQGIWGWQP